MSLKRPRCAPLDTSNAEEHVELDEDAALAADGHLPDVDDLEVAAAAAYGILEPAWVVQRVMAPPGESMVTPMAVSAADPTPTQPVHAPMEEEQQQSARVRISITTSGTQCSLQLVPTTADETIALSSASSTSSSSDAEDDDQDDTTSSDSNVGMTEAEYLTNKAQVEEMMAAAVADDVNAHSKVNIATELGMPTLEHLDISITEDIPLHPAGTLTSIVEGCLVVQGTPGAPPLDLGSALCTDSRQPLGIVEDVFGPVAAPLYVLRMACKGPLPGGVGPGTAVFAVSSMMHVIEAAVLSQQQQQHSGMGGGASEEDEDEVAFSDDEKEAAFYRQQGGKGGGQGGGKSGGQGGGGEMPPHNGGGGAHNGGGAQGRGGRGGAHEVGSHAPPVGTAGQYGGRGKAMRPQHQRGSRGRGRGGRGGASDGGGARGGGRGPQVYQHQHNGGGAAVPAVPGAMNAESLLASYQQSFHWQPQQPQPQQPHMQVAVPPPHPPPPRPPPGPPPGAAYGWQQGGMAYPQPWAPAPPQALPPNYQQQQHRR